MDSGPTAPTADGPAPLPGRSLEEAHRSIAVPAGANFWRKLVAFSGPGYLVAVGYMDPGNWATDIQGGSAYGYTLLSVILLSNVMAILLQALSARLGIATGRDLAQACREHYSRPVSFGLWVLCEIAIAACDLAEVIGTAIALNLLFHLPLVWGVSFTALDVLVVLWLGHHGFRWLEILVVSVILLIGLCFGFELCFARPAAGPMLRGLVPDPAILTHPGMLYAAIGIIGATVMPHNLYLHSSIVQTRKYDQDSPGRLEAARFASLDSFLALMFALLINGAILVVAAATFYTQGRHDVAEIQDAYRLLSPMLGAGLASAIFAVALLASGQNSTLTGTLAGQIVMEGFLKLRIGPTRRALLTRALAIGPALVAVIAFGDHGSAQLLVASQVVLSLQLPLAVIPLVLFAASPALMGRWRIRGWVLAATWASTALILALNVALLWQLWVA
jgi:manganese transport protein